MASKAKKKKRTKQTKKNVSESSFLGDEIVIWSALAVSILLLISNFGLGGKAGVFLSAFLTDIFGWTVYAVPFALFGAVAFLTANKDNFTAYAKTAAGFLLMILFCIFFVKCIYVCTDYIVSTPMITFDYKLIRQNIPWNIFGFITHK